MEMGSLEKKVTGRRKKADNTELRSKQRAEAPPRPGPQLPINPALNPPHESQTDRSSVHID